jgi:multiple sugar transport system substrate-binding protein
VFGKPLRSQVGGPGPRPGLKRRGAGAAALALLLLAGIVISACGSDASAANTLRWFIAIQPGGSIQEIAKTCTDQSNGKYRIELELLPTDASQQREQLVRRLGAEDSSIDLIGMDVVWTAEFANAGWLREWSAEDAKQVTDGVFEPVVESASFEGKLYGAPLNSNTQLLWYRTDLVDEPPETWDEMIDQAEGLDMKVQVQAARYEGYTVWVNAMIESAGTQILSGPTEVGLEPEKTAAGLAPIGRLAHSSAAPVNLSTSNEDTARLGFEAGNSAFMVNYTFAYGSAKENAPKVAQNMGAARYPGIKKGEPSKPPLGGFNIGVSTYSQKPDLAFEAAKCLNAPEQQLTMTELDGLAPARAASYDEPEVKQAFEGFADIVKESIENAGPRPSTPAYQDVTLAIQSALHPPSSINPKDPQAAAERLRKSVEQGVKREGLL